MMSDELLEIWESQIRGREGVVRVLPGGVTDVELIKGGSTFSITPQERRLTDGAASNPKRRPFQCGVFRPVELIDSAEDYNRLKDALAVSMTDEDIDKIYEDHFKTVEKRIKSIDSPFTLRRILERGEELGAAQSRLELVRGRLAEVEPKVEPKTEPNPNDDVDEGPGGAPRRRRQSYYPDADTGRGRVASAGG